MPSCHKQLANLIKDTRQNCSLMLSRRQGRAWFLSERQQGGYPSPSPAYWVDGVSRLREGNPKLSPAVSVLLGRGARWEKAEAKAARIPERRHRPEGKLWGATPGSSRILGQYHSALEWGEIPRGWGKNFKRSRLNNCLSGHRAGNSLCSHQAEWNNLIICETWGTALRRARPSFLGLLWTCPDKV